MADWKDALIAKTEDTTPDITADMLLIYDDSAGVLKKTKPTNVVGTVLAAIRAAFTAASSSSAAALAFAEDTDNGSNKITVTAPASIASDKTQTLQDVSGTIALTKARVVTEASNATPTPDADSTDLHMITAQAAAAAFAAPSGTPTEGQSMIIRIKDNGTARALSFNAIYRAIGVTLPTTTVISKTLYLGMIYNSTDSKWDVLGVMQEA